MVKSSDIDTGEIFTSENDANWLTGYTENNISLSVVVHFVTKNKRMVYFKPYIHISTDNEDVVERLSRIFSLQSTKVYDYKSRNILAIQDISDIRRCIDFLKGLTFTNKDRSESIKYFSKAVDLIEEVIEKNQGKKGFSYYMREFDDIIKMKLAINHKTHQLDEWSERMLNFFKGL